MTDQARKSRAGKRLERLVALITDVEADAAMAELQQLLNEGVDPKLLLDCCMEGMRRVGELFENGTYYIAALIMAGEIMRTANNLLCPLLDFQQSTEGGGRILIGTIQGDIHDVGKDLFALLLRCHGIEIIDMGVDVSAESFLKKAEIGKPDIIAISCVLTACIDTLKEAMALLQTRLPSPKPFIIVGGTCLDKLVAKYVGAKYWASDAAGGLRICRQLLGKAHP